MSHSHAKTTTMKGAWETLNDRILLWRDSCNVYAVRGTEGRWIIINAGTGLAESHLDELGDAGGISLVLTHHFRDHTAGAELLRRRGVRVFAPHFEREHLSGAQAAFRSRDNWLLYELGWDSFAPVAPIKVDRWLMDYEKTMIAGLQVEIIPTPGVTMGAVSLIVDLPGDGKVAFIGELMSAPGKLSRLSPLQYEYNDLTGGENILLSWERVLSAGASVAYPSIGVPITDPRAGVAALRHNLARVDEIQPGYSARLAANQNDDIEEVLPRLYRATGTVAETHFILGKSGKVLALDYGYGMAGIRFPRRAAFSTRRPILHSVEALGKITGHARIDTVLATHYHDDHIGCVHMLQRLFGTELWAGENFADLIDRPYDFDRPCLWPETIKVSRRLPLGKTIYWEDIAITLHPMVGHTEFSTLLCLEFDGNRVAHTGDQFFFQTARGQNSRATADGGIFTNHVYKNGLSLGGYAACLEHLRSFKPDTILSGHALPYRPDPVVWELLGRAAVTFDEIHLALMQLGDDEVHFGPESQAAKLQPYSLWIPRGACGAQLHGWILNPFNRSATANARFVTPPPGWLAKDIRLDLGPREKRTFQTTLAVPVDSRFRRQPIALELTIDDRPFGQVAEAWVTVGYDEF